MYSLHGKKALIVGVANDQSIAYGCAAAMKRQGANLAVTYLNEKAEAFVRPLAEQLEAEIIEPLDVNHPEQELALFDTIKEKWGKLDIMLHSIAYCPKGDLHGRVIDCSSDGFQVAMNTSVHSFLRLIKLAEPLMPRGGSCITVSFYASQEVVPDYNIMGPVKAALESVTRYAAAELGEKMITVNALSPGPLATRAASGIAHFDAMLEDAAKRAPTHQLATIDDIGSYAAFLASPEARNVTGAVLKIDGGYSIMG